MIVEDSADARESLALLLELRGHHVVALSNGREALELIRGGRVRPCAVVLDLIMPEMDGLAFLRDVRLAVSREVAIPVIVFTGHDGFRKEALAEGCTAALLKPAKPGELIGLIENHCPPSTPAP